MLELDDVIETDAGLYKVKAKNKMGEVAASINLNFSREYISTIFCDTICLIINIYEMAMYTRFWKVDGNPFSIWLIQFRLFLII